MGKYRVGIDLGGTNIKAGVVDEEYRIVGTARCKTGLPRPSGEVLSDMARMAREAVENAGIRMEDVLCVGVGSPGTANPVDGVVEYSCNLDFDHVPVCAEMEKMLGKPVYLENDANAAAFGEALAGAARGSKSCVCITLGTGVGGGVVCDGRLVAGKDGCAGEIGHLTVNPHETARCGCGRRGCLEQYASATGVVRSYREACERLGTQPVPLSGPSDSYAVFQALGEGDEAAAEAVDAMCSYLAQALVTISAVVNPGAFVIGGGMGEAFDAFSDQLVSKFRKRCLGPVANTRFERASLGNRAGIYGSAYQALVATRG